MNLLVLVRPERAMSMSSDPTFIDGTAKTNTSATTTAGQITQVTGSTYDAWPTKRHTA